MCVFLTNIMWSAKKFDTHHCYWYNSFKFRAWVRTHQTISVGCVLCSMVSIIMRYAFFSRLKKNTKVLQKQKLKRGFSFPSLRWSVGQWTYFYSSTYINKVCVHMCVCMCVHWPNRRISNVIFDVIDLECLARVMFGSFTLFSCFRIAIITFR